MESDVMSDIPDRIDKMFEKYNKKAEILLRKYDRDFSEIEEELRLSSKLRMIRKQKEKLQANTDKQKETRKSRSPPRKEIPTKPKSVSESDEEQCKDYYSEKNAKKAYNAVENDQEKELERKLELSIQLAAKYKEQAIEMETRLNEVARSEQGLRSYLNAAAQQEVEAKKKLEEFITELLVRAETAEERVKVYKSSLSMDFPSASKKPNRHRSLPLSTPPNSASRNMKPPHQKYYSSSSAPATPRPSQNKLKLPRKNFPSEVNDNYVAQFLEAPSSQELPRRWNKLKDRSVDQLPGVDLSNIIDSSVIWPFADTNPHQKSSSNRSTSIRQSPHFSIPHSEESETAVRRRIVLFCVFAYLDTETLLQCSIVSREWRDVSKHPKLWSRVKLDAKQISSQFLVTLSTWCKETCYISLTNIKGRNRQLGESSKEYSRTAVGSLEDGMECLLQACGSNLTILDINKCDPFLTRRVIWMASCYNRELRSITYRSHEPLSQEVTWSLGAGCRKLLSLDVAPLQSCKTPQVFNNKVLQMISWCWSSLRGLSIGGRCIDKKGLLSIATGCQNLQVLELTYMNEITEDLAKDLVKYGLGTLRSLILTHTPIRPRALACLLQLSSRQSLVSLRVQLSFSDYCPTQNNQPAVIFGDKMDRSELFEAFNTVMQSLMRLQRKHPDVLQVICTA